jgi:type IV secretory pathway VirB6-like protein
MDWSTYLEQFQNFVLFRFSQPPYILLIIGLLISLMCGLPFVITLLTRVRNWYQNTSPLTFTKWAKLELLIPFLGTLSGVCIIFASMLEIFGLSTFLSYLISLVATSLIGSLVWSEIGMMLGRNVLRSYLSNFSKLSHQR